MPPKARSSKIEGNVKSKAIVYCSYLRKYDIEASGATVVKSTGLKKVLQILCLLLRNIIFDNLSVPTLIFHISMTYVLRQRVHKINRGGLEFRLVKK